MTTLTTRSVTDQERAAVVAGLGTIRPESLRSVLAFSVASTAIPTVIVTGTLLWLTGPNDRRAFLYIYVGGWDVWVTSIVVVLCATLRRNRSELAGRKAIRAAVLADLERGSVQVLRIAPDAVYRIREPEEHGVRYCYRLGDREAFLVCSAFFEPEDEPRAESVDGEEKADRFVPHKEIESVLLPVSRWVVSTTMLEEPMSVSGSIRWPANVPDPPYELCFPFDWTRIRIERGSSSGTVGTIGPNDSEIVPGNN